MSLTEDQHPVGYLRPGGEVGMRVKLFLDHPGRIDRHRAHAAYPRGNFEIVVSPPVVKSSRPMPLPAAESNSPMAAPAIPPGPNLTPPGVVTLPACSARAQSPGIAPKHTATGMALADGTGAGEEVP
jgi:hypothetical protein